MEHSTSSTPDELVGISLIAQLGRVCAATAQRKLDRAGFKPDAVAVLLGKRVPLYRPDRLKAICETCFPAVQVIEKTAQR